MFIKGRWKGAVLMCLLWVAGAVAVQYFKPFDTTDQFFWIFVALSIITFAMSLIIFLGMPGWINVRFGNAPESGQSESYIVRYTLIWGILSAFLSFLFFLRGAFEGDLGTKTIYGALGLIFFMIIVFWRMMK